MATFAHFMMNNAYEVDAKAQEDKLRTAEPLLLNSEEHIELALKEGRDGRDKSYFTTHRILVKDGKGIGKKRKNFRSLPYSSIHGFSVSTSGAFDDDTELEVWGSAGCLKLHLAKGQVDLFGVQQFLSQRVLSFYSTEGTPDAVPVKSAGLVGAFTSWITGDASTSDNAKVEQRFKTETPVLLQNETVQVAFKTGRDFLVLTNCRILRIDVKGILGKKVKFESILWNTVAAATVATSAGIFDRDMEMTKMAKSTSSLEKRKSSSSDRPSKRAKGDSLATIGPSTGGSGSGGVTGKSTPKSAKKTERRKEGKSQLEGKIISSDDELLPPPPPPPPEEGEDDEEVELASQQEPQQPAEQQQSRSDQTRDGSLPGAANVGNEMTSSSQDATIATTHEQPQQQPQVPVSSSSLDEPSSSSLDRVDHQNQNQHPPKKKGRPPKIDTGLAVIGGVEDASTTGTTATTSTTTAPAKTSAAQDQHPFARSSVIEVWHGVEDPSEDSWWTEDSDSESEQQQDETTTTTSTTGTSPNNPQQQQQQKHKFKTKEGKQASIRLCDVIDRVPVGDANSGKWRYYVHYRDFNRRMDEWISMERIVSPPSIGNAKARALKVEEEKQKRKHAKKEEKNKELIIDVSAPRASRRRSTSTMASMDTPRGRRKSLDDDVTVVTANSTTPHGSTTAGGAAAATAGEDKLATDTATAIPVPPPPLPITIAEKGIVALPTEAVHKTTVGEHVVETIAAQELDEHEGLDEASLREHEEVTKVKNVAFIELGAFQMETWYFSPLPKELLSERGLIEVLYVCEFTFSLFARKSELRRFQSRLPVHARHPPGNEIYRCGNLSMFEVDGFEERIYCQNLCYIAKLFLDHKTLYFDVDPFLFYVLCEVDDRGFHPVGYFSKEKYSDVGYNLACILTFPCHQRKGYGRFLIAFSYELSKKEEKVGSPEKPMSDLGQQAYKPYWASTIVDFLLNQAPEASSLSIMDISKITSIMAEDIVFTLNQLGILKIINGVYFIAAEQGLLETLAKKYPVKEPRVDPSKLHWTPFLTDIKRDKFSIHSKKPSVEGDDLRGSGGFP